MADINLGHATAYGYAKSKGYTGTEEEFAQIMMNWTNIPEDITNTVDDWLDEHPEATTTVQDGSLTYNKLVTGTLGFVTPQMYGAVGDGVTDDTEAIQDCVDANSFVFIPSGTYLIDGTYNGFNDAENGGIKVKDNRTIVMANDCIIKVKTNTTDFYNAFSVSDCSDVIIMGGKIIGDRQTHATGLHHQGYGISLTDTKNIFIENVEISEMYADGIILHGSVGDEITGSNTNVVINHCYIHDCNRQGISVVIGDNVTIRDCVIDKIEGSEPQSGIDIEPLNNGVNTNYARNILVDKCVVTNTAGNSINYTRCNNISFLGVFCDNVVRSNGTAKNINHDSCVYSYVNHSGNDYIKYNRCIIVGVLNDGSNIGAYTFTGCDFNNRDGSSVSFVYFVNNVNAETVFNDCLFEPTNLTEKNLVFFYGSGKVVAKGCKFKCTSQMPCYYIQSNGDGEYSNCSIDVFMKTVNDFVFKLMNRLSLNGCHIKTDSNNIINTATSYEGMMILLRNNFFESLAQSIIVNSSNASTYAVAYLNNVKTNTSNIAYVASGMNVNNVNNVNI